MDNTNANGIKEGLNEGGNKGYVKVIVYILLAGIGFVATQFLLLQSQKNALEKEHKAEIRRIEDKNQNREDSISIALNNRYQIVLDRERAGFVKTIEILEKRVNKIDNNSDINGTLAISNANKVKRNRRVIVETHRLTQ